MNESLLGQAQAFATKQLSELLPEKFVFHDLTHTEQVVSACKELAEVSNLTDEEKLILELAAWFHDLGYITSCKDHEEESVKVTRSFLEERGQSEAFISQVESCILATKMPQQPTTELEKILCDADLSKLAKKSFYKRGMLLKEEWERVGALECGKPESDWVEGSLEFLRSHTYHTDYALKNWTPGKLKNEKRLLAKMEEMKEKPAKKSFGRGVETMFRTSSRNHIQLSAIADNKASLMLSINAIIISILVSVLVPSLDANPNLVIPTIVLLAVCVLSIVFATISTIPKVTHGTFTKQDIIDKKANLLFFGNFHSVSLEDFEYGIGELMQDQDFLYSSMSRDLYFLGKVLNQKYRYLRICYGIFMFGLIISVIAFIISFITA